MKHLLNKTSPIAACLATLFSLGAGAQHPATQSLTITIFPTASGTAHQTKRSSTGPDYLGISGNYLMQTGNSSSLHRLPAACDNQFQIEETTEMPGAHTSFLLDVTEREALVHRVGHPLFEFFSPVTGYYHDSEFLAGWAGGAEWPSNSQYEKKPMLLSSMTLARDRSTSHTDTTRVALVSSPWYNQPPLAHSHFYKDIIVFEVGISSETVAYAFDIDSALPQHILIKEIKEVRYHHPHLVAVVKPYTTDFDYLSVLYFDVTTGTGVELSRHFGLETTADVNAQYVMWSGRMVACEHEEFGDQYPAEGCEINPRNHIYYWVIGSNILHQPWNSYTPQWWNTPQSTPPDIETIERSFPRVFDEPASVNPVADYRHPRLGRNHLMFSYVQSGKRFVLLYDLRRLYVDWAVDELQDTSVWNDWTPLYDIASGPEGDARFAWFTVSPGFVNELRLACIEP